MAGLIKAWFRELPSGVLDGLSPEQVLQCNTEEESVELVSQLKPTDAALLNWAVDLMADVVEEEESNKMNARNIAMVFAPNMTQVKNHHLVSILELPPLAYRSSKIEIMDFFFYFLAFKHKKDMFKVVTNNLFKVGIVYQFC